MFAEMSLIHAAALFATTFWLIWMAMLDVRDRQVPNGILLAALTTTLPLWILMDWHGWLTLTLPWFAGLTVLALMLWATRSIGGADAKGMMWLGLCLQPSAIFNGYPMPALLLATAISLSMAMLWQRLSTGTPYPFFVSLGPLVILFHWATWML